MGFLYLHGQFGCERSLFQHVLRRRLSVTHSTSCHCVVLSADWPLWPLSWPFFIEIGSKLHWIPVWFLITAPQALGLPAGSLCVWRQLFAAALWLLSRAWRLLWGLARDSLVAYYFRGAAWWLRDGNEYVEMNRRRKREVLLNRQRSNHCCVWPVGGSFPFKLGF